MQSTVSGVSIICFPSSTLLTLGYVSTRQILEGLNIPISIGTIQNILDTTGKETTPAVEKIWEMVSKLQVTHCDETGIDIKGVLLLGAYKTSLSNKKSVLPNLFRLCSTD